MKTPYRRVRNGYGYAICPTCQRFVKVLATFSTKDGITEAEMYFKCPDCGLEKTSRTRWDFDEIAASDAARDAGRETGEDE